MHITALLPDPLRCPLCGQPNGCLNLGAQDVSKSCWCNDPAITFPAALLARLPPEHRGKACICRACALAFAREQQTAAGRAPDE